MPRIAATRPAARKWLADWSRTMAIARFMPSGNSAYKEPSIMKMRHIALRNSVMFVSIR